MVEVRAPNVDGVVTRLQIGVVGLVSYVECLRTELEFCLAPGWKILEQGHIPMTKMRAMIRIAAFIPRRYRRLVGPRQPDLVLGLCFR